MKGQDGGVRLGVNLVNRSPISPEPPWSKRVVVLAARLAARLTKGLARGLENWVAATEQLSYQYKSKQYSNDPQIGSVRYTCTRSNGAVCQRLSACTANPG